MDDALDTVAFLTEGRQLLEQATEVYGRPLSPVEYWWLGVGLAAVTLADLGDKSYAVGRVEQLLERLGYKGVKGDWLQRFVEELASLDSEGLLWPVYQRTGAGPVEPTGVEITPAFNAQAGYFVALGHIAVAAAVNRNDQETVNQVAGAIMALVEAGVSPESEATILAALRPVTGAK
jgi:hypothetical protein